MSRALTGVWIALIGGAWLNYELGHWGGAEALAVMTLILLWPDWRLWTVCGVGPGVRRLPFPRIGL
jgi:hypothetical protein